MMKVLVVCGIVLVLANPSPSCGQYRWQDRIGNYHPIVDSGVVRRGVNNFWYFTLEPGNAWECIDTLGSLAHWFPIYPPEDTIGAACPIAHIRLSEDSLSFETQACNGSQFTFQGRYLITSGRLVERESEPVIEGTLRYFKEGKLIEQGKFKFIFDDNLD